MATITLLNKVTMSNNKLLSMLGGESMTYEASAYYRLTKNGMKKLELRLVLIQDVIFGCSYQLQYVEID
jgi:hypothetical protein